MKRCRAVLNGIVRVTRNFVVCTLCAFREICLLILIELLCFCQQLSSVAKLAILY